MSARRFMIRIGTPGRTVACRGRPVCLPALLGAADEEPLKAHPDDQEQ